MSVFSETKSLISSAPQAAYVEAAGLKGENAVANEVMRSPLSGGRGQLGFGATANTKEVYYDQYKQWVYVCIDAIASRLKCLNWIAGELKGADPNPERRGRFGLKAPGKSSEKVASEMNLMRGMNQSLIHKLAEGQDFEQIVGHNALDLLAKPNPVQHGPEYLQMMAMNLLISGEAYVVGGPFSDSDVGFELWSVPTKWITPRHEGALFSSFIFTPNTFAAQQELPVDEVMRVYFPHPEDPKKAYSPLMSAFNSAVVDDKLQKSQADHFDSGMFPNVALRVAKLRNADGTQSNNRPMLNSSQRRQITRAVRQVWKQTTANKDPAILDGLIEEVFKLTHAPNEMDWPNSGKIIKERIYHAFRVNPIITGEIAGANRAQAVMVEKTFVANVVNPIADSISTAHTEFIGPWYETPQRLVVYLEKAVPEDEELRLKKWQEARKNSDVTSNEFRTHILGLPPLTNEDREEQSAPLLGVAGGFSNAITLAKDVKSKSVPRESAIELVMLFLGVTEETANKMFPEPPEDPVDPMTGLPVGVVPPAGFISNSDLFGNQASEVDEKPDPQEITDEDEDDKSEKGVRSLFQKAMKQVFVKQVSEDSKAVLDAMIPFLKSQVESAAEQLRVISGVRIASCIHKSQFDTSVALAVAVFDPNKWTGPMVQTLAPVLSKIAAHGAFTELAFIEEAQSNNKTTASDVVQQLGAQGLDGISTEWPVWMQNAVRGFIAQQFAQSYWAGIADTTLSDIRAYIEAGLNEGWSIRRIASEIDDAFTESYYSGRGLNIARTETSDALNAGHTMAIRETGNQLGDTTAVQKEWLSVLGSTTRETHADANGQLVGVDQAFSVGGFATPHPGHHSLPASERCNCQCTVISAFGMDKMVSKSVDL